MSWLNQTLATPTVGVRFGHRFRPAQLVLSDLEQFLDDLAEAAGSFNCQENPPFGIEIAAGDGFQYKITYRELIASYSYRRSESSVPGELPDVAFGSIKPFTELMDELFERVERILPGILNEKGRSLARMGIVADAEMKLESPPPGVEQLLEHLRGFWPGELRKTNSQFLAMLRDEDTLHEQCHHHLRFSVPDEPELLGIKLDWQRVFSEPTEFSRKQIVDQLDECRDLALDYFDNFAAGV